MAAASLYAAYGLAVSVTDCAIVFTPQSVSETFFGLGLYAQLIYHDLGNFGSILRKFGQIGDTRML